jgi:hypothetical protein
VTPVKRGDFSTCDAPRPGRPKTVTTPEIIDQIHEPISTTFVKTHMQYLQLGNTLQTRLSFKAAVSFIMSVCLSDQLSFRMEHFGFH